MKKLIIALVSLIYAGALSGCIIPLALGAAGGAYFEKNYDYDVTKKDDDGQESTDQASDTDKSSDTDQASDSD